MASVLLTRRRFLQLLPAALVPVALGLPVTAPSAPARVPGPRAAGLVFPCVFPLTLGKESGKQHGTRLSD